MRETGLFSYQKTKKEQGNKLKNQFELTARFPSSIVSLKLFQVSSCFKSQVVSSLKLFLVSSCFNIQVALYGTLHLMIRFSSGGWPVGWLTGWLAKFNLTLFTHILWKHYVNKNSEFKKRRVKTSTNQSTNRSWTGSLDARSPCLNTQIASSRFKPVVVWNQKLLQNSST